MKNNIRFIVDLVFSIKERGLMLVGLTEEQRNYVRPGDGCIMQISVAKHISCVVTGVEYPNHWIVKPKEPRFGILIKPCEPLDKDGLIGCEATIIPQD